MPTDPDQCRRAARLPRPSLWISKLGPTKHALSVKLPTDQYRAAIRAAQAEGGNVSRFLREAVNERTRRVLGGRGDP